MQQYHVQAQPQVSSQAQYSPRQLLESARRAEADGNIDLAAHVARYVLEHFAGSPESAEAYNSLMRLGQPPIEQAPLVPTVPVAPPQQHGPAPPAGPPARYHGVHGAGPQSAAWAPPPPAMQPPPHGSAYAHGHAASAPPAAARAPLPHAVPQAVPQGAAYGAQMQTTAQTIAATFAPAAPYRGAEAAPAKLPAMIHHAPEVTPQYRGGRIVARLAFAVGFAMIFAGLATPVPALMGMLGPQASLLGTGLVACALIATGLLALLGGQTALAVFDQADNMRELVELERTRWSS